MLNVLSVAAIPYLYNFVSGDNGQNRLIANKFSEIKVQLEDSGANINVEKYEEFRDRFLKMREKYPFSANSRNRFRLF